MPSNTVTSLSTLRPRSSRRAVAAAALASSLVLGACGGSPTTVESSGPSLGSTATLPADAGPDWQTTTTTTAALNRSSSDAKATTSGAAAAPLADGATPGAVLLRAAQDTRSLESFRFAMEVSVSGMSDIPSELGSLDLKVSGAQAANGDSSLIIDMSQLGEIMNEAMAGEGDLGEEAAMAAMFMGMFDEPMEMREIGGQSYMRMGGLLSMFGMDTDKDWIVSESGTSDMGDDLDEMVPFIDSENPASILAAINGSGDVEIVGTEDVDGVSTTHYRGTLDPKAADSAATPEERASIEDALDGMDFEDLTGVPVPAEVWVGDDGFVRRLRLSMDESHIEDPDEDGFDALTIDMRFSDLGESIAIDVPPADSVTTEEELSSGFGASFGFEDEGA